MRNQLVVKRNGLGKSLVLFPKMDLTDAVIYQSCTHVFSPIISFYFFKLMKIVIFFYWGKSFDIVVYTIVYGVGAGIGNFDVHFQRIGPVFFSVGRWKGLNL